MHTSYLTVYQRIDKRNTRDETHVLCDMKNNAYRIHEFPRTLVMETLMGAIEQRRNASTCACGRKHARLLSRMAAHRQHAIATKRVNTQNELTRIWRTQQYARDSIIAQRDFDHALTAGRGCHRHGVHSERRTHAHTTRDTLHMELLQRRRAHSRRTFA
jgi:hypothetical protein